MGRQQGRGCDASHTLTRVHTLGGVALCSMIAPRWHRPCTHASPSPTPLAQVFTNQRDAQWDTWTCVLGFNVMGVWQKYSDGTDIHALCRWGGEGRSSK